MPPVAVAKVNGTIVAESNLYEKVEDNVYFPPAAVNYQYLKPSTTKSYCPWKGECSYYNIEVGETVIPDGAWYYPDPKDKFLDCKDFVAFYKNKPDLSIGTIME
ncbi:DUF427 domain protein [Tricharina praecox]|uniref:DUF427 domain protein n=1 Tax=Tricharina praecox TaxID=43433 RepID=UPI00221EDCC5|nr:DUF427 domain protein [Tricharina praecox]KAI5848151.1 DUF427 domain protein [Tricharina praecox]